MNGTATTGNGEHGKFFSLLIKPVGSRCNLDCRYCFYQGTDDLLGGQRVDVMSDDVLERMLEDYLGYGFPTSVFIWQGGEPTLAGLDFFRRVVNGQMRIGRNGQVVANAFQTNGMLIDDDWAGFFAKYRFLVGLSLDGPPDVHDHYRVDHGCQPTHDRVMRAAATMNRHGAEFNILTMITARSQDRGAEVYRYLVDNDFHHLQFIPCIEYDPETGEPMPYNVTPEGYGRFMSDVFDAWYDRDVGRVSVRTFETLVARYAGLEQPSMCIMGSYCDHYLVVEKEGEVYPCDFFVKPDLYLGSLMERSLSKIFASGKEAGFSAIKGRHDDGCRTCPWLYICHGGCPKDRLCAGGGSFGGKTWLCDGLKAFYSHVADRVDGLAGMLRQGAFDGGGESHEPVAAGRNDPCPCGSGRKFKNCCMRR